MENRNYERHDRDFGMWVGVIQFCARILGSYDALAERINQDKEKYGAEEGRPLLGAHLSMVVSGQRKFQIWLKFSLIELAASLGWNPLYAVEKAATYTLLLRLHEDFDLDDYRKYFKKVTLSDEDLAAINQELKLYPPRKKIVVNNSGPL